MGEANSSNLFLLDPQRCHTLETSWLPRSNPTDMVAAYGLHTDNAWQSHCIVKANIDNERRFCPDPVRGVQRGHRGVHTRMHLPYDSVIPKKQLSSSMLEAPYGVIRSHRSISTAPTTVKRSGVMRVGRCTIGTFPGLEGYQQHKPQRKPRRSRSVNASLVRELQSSQKDLTKQIMELRR